MGAAGKSNNTQQTTAQQGQQLNNSISSSNTKLDDFRNLSVQDAASMVNALNYSRHPLENNHNLLQSLVNTVGLNGKPTVVDNATFDSMVKTDGLDGYELYRGFGWQSDDKVINDFKFSDHAYMGDGVHGNGLYFTTRASYASNQYSGPNKDHTTITAIIDKNRARVIDENSLRSQYRSETGIVKNMFSKHNTNDAIAMYAVYKGYNVIKAKNGNGTYSVHGHFYIPLDRSILIIRDKTKVR